MNADDYQKLKGIFNSALDVPPEDRGAFVAEKCGGDDELFRRVEKLLDSNDNDFLETPAGDAFSEGPTSGGSRSGQRIGHYEVIRRVGSGGMGDVYLAVDGKLGRQVAIKFLPDEFTTDENRLDRFQLEARSASSLSHPNILTIFEVGEWQGTHYIATEYVEGETLRQRLSRERLSIGEAMDLGIQLASGIAAAHEASICHRDIKPENIMIRRDGLLKVVDFGLAKLVTSPFRSGSSPLNDEPTVKIVNTEPGVIMGTVQYMSPEQTRGLATDERSDIWSLGCVLYEMLTGHAPFAGETSADMVAEIVKTHPELPSRLASDVPERLDEIISKALEKSPDERYQTAKDLLIDLKRLKRNLELEDELERSNPSMRTEPVTAVTSGPNIISTKKGPKDLTEVNSAEYLYWGIKAHRWTAIGITLFIIGLVGGTALLVRHYWRATEIVEQPVFLTPIVQRLTGDGRSEFAAISPDGNFLSVVRNHGGEFSLSVKQIATNSNVQLVAPGIIKEYNYLTFSPDGNFIYFTGVNETTTDMSSIFRVPTLGGEMVEVVHHAGWPSFSPDGKRLVFHTEETMTDGSIEWKSEIIDVDGKNRRKLASTFGSRVMWKPAWSPDGNLIACAISDDSEKMASIALIDAFTGDTKETIRGDWAQVMEIVWRPDMTGLFLEGRERNAPTGAMQIWEVSLPKGEIRQLSQGLGHYKGVSLTKDGDNLISVLEETRTAIWVSPNQDLQRAAPITSGPGHHVQLTWTNDKRLVFSSAATGYHEFWSINSDGTGEKQLTNDKSDRKLFPIASPDGRYLFYAAGIGREMKIWRREIDGSKAIQLTNGPFDLPVDMTPDGRWVIYDSRTSDRFLRFRVPIDGGKPIEIIRPVESQGPGRVSPDGKSYAAVMSKGDEGKLQIGIADVNGAAFSKTFELPGPLLSFWITWTPNGKSITYVDVAGNLWKQPLVGGPPTKLSNYKENGILEWDWSNDGKQLALIRGDDTADAVSLTGF